MKIVKLSTTNKLYLLTLLVIFGVIFLNQSVFGQEQTKATTTQKRLKIMERYLTWVETNEYGTFQNEPGKKILSNFKSFLTDSIKEDKDCLASGNSQDLQSTPTFIGNIETFFSGLVSGGQTASNPPTQTVSCKGKIKDDYKLAKKYNRALKYLQIQEGQPNVCVQADLGVGTALKARGFNPAKAPSAGSGQADNPKETGVSEKLPLYLCTGNDGKKKVRVVDDSGTRLRLAPGDIEKSEFKVENLPPKGSFEILLGKIGL